MKFQLEIKEIENGFILCVPSDDRATIKQFVAADTEVLKTLVGTLYRDHREAQMVKSDEIKPPLCNVPMPTL